MRRAGIIAGLCLIVAAVDGFFCGGCTAARGHHVSLSSSPSRTASEEVVAPPQPPRYTFDADGPKITWSANKQANRVVREEGRSLIEYLGLPPSQYSVLDPKTILRTGDDTFTCRPGGLNFFGVNVEPVLYIRVAVDAAKATANLSIEAVELDGSDALRQIRNAYNVSCSNVVSYTEVTNKKSSRFSAIFGGLTDRNRELRADDAAGNGKPRADDGASAEKALTSTVNLRVDLIVPRESWLPPVVLQRGGTFILQRVLDIGVPQFLRFLRRDYEKWAAGDDSRGAVEEAGALLSVGADAAAVDDQ